MQVLAQVVQEHAANVLLTYGPLGVITGWFMLRGEKVMVEIKSLRSTIDKMTKAMLIDVVSRENTGFQARQKAKEIMDELDRESEKD